MLEAYANQEPLPQSLWQSLLQSLWQSLWQSLLQAYANQEPLLLQNIILVITAIILLVTMACVIWYTLITAGIHKNMEDQMTAMKDQVTATRAQLQAMVAQTDASKAQLAAMQTQAHQPYQPVFSWKQNIKNLKTDDYSLILENEGPAVYELVVNIERPRFIVAEAVTPTHLLDQHRNIYLRFLLEGEPIQVKEELPEDLLIRIEYVTISHKVGRRFFIFRKNYPIPTPAPVGMETI